MQQCSWLPAEATTPQATLETHLLAEGQLELLLVLLDQQLGASTGIPGAPGAPPAEARADGWRWLVLLLWDIITEQSL